MIDYEGLAALLSGWDNITILTHKSPDGDCIGAGLALCYYLRAMGKRANVLNSDGIPQRFSFLSEGYTQQEFEERHVVSVDVADTQLLGERLEHYSDRIDLCIDHHRTSKKFAARNFIDPDASATCLVLYELFEHMGGTPSGIVASCLYTGIATDTGCFKFQNTTPAAHRAAARLMELGADYEEINRRMFDIKSRGRLAAEQILIGGIRYFDEGGIAVIVITNEFIEKYGIDRAELDGMASIPLNVEGVKIGITMKQQEDNPECFKVSLRTVCADACEIAEKFGGGRHVRAAGCTVSGSADSALLRIVSEAEKYL